MSVEVPPPYNPVSPQQWSEELVDYLTRQFASITAILDDQQAQLDSLDARVTALETP